MSAVYNEMCQGTAYNNQPGGNVELPKAFVFQPEPDSGADLVGAAASKPGEAAALGDLVQLAGTWDGYGFNAIWRPHFGPGSDRFLQLNLTHEQLEIEPIRGSIPNRGLLQDDINMGGLRYLQAVSDLNLARLHKPAGIHIESGMWLSVPATSNPALGTTVARLGSIPHGTTVLLQGTAAITTGEPAIPASSITPFSINEPQATFAFAEQTLASVSAFRTVPALLEAVSPHAAAVDQLTLDNPNSRLVADNTRDGVGWSSILTLDVSSSAAPTPGVAATDTPVPGGGLAETAFLAPNADVSAVHATFWLETIAGETLPSRLQYSQTVLLNFNGITWPHVSVATLTRAKSA